MCTTIHALVLWRNNIELLESRSITAQNLCIDRSTNSITYNYSSKLQETYVIYYKSEAIKSFH